MQATIDQFARSLNEYLNPMLLRELRQGIRSKVFLGVFLLLQGGMIFSMLLAMAASLSPNDSSAMGPANFFFWVTVVTPLLLTLPLKGSVAISGESRGGTLELLFLTRLTAWRTVGGKWAAILGQAFLVITALLPYSFMRYYLGGVDLLAELGLLAQVFLLCGLVSAMLIAMSAFSGGMVKGAMLLGGLAFVCIWGMSVEDVRSAVYSAIFSSRDGLLAVFGIWALLILFFLQLGAARIAPPAENYTMRKRFMGLTFLIGLPGLLCALDLPLELAITVALSISGILMVESLMEPTIPLRSLYHAPGSNPFLSGMIRYLFSPGWCSGIFYALIYMAIATWVVWPLVQIYCPGDSAYRLFLVLNTSAIAIFPCAIWGLFRPTARCGPVFYLILTMSAFVLAVLSWVLSKVANQDFNQIIACLPHGQFFSVVSQQSGHAAFQDMRLLTLAAGISGLCWLICIGRACQRFHEISTGAIEIAPEGLDDPTDAEAPSMA